MVRHRTTSDAAGCAQGLVERLPNQHVKHAGGRQKPMNCVVKTHVSGACRRASLIIPSGA